jgi:hypothetical protein
VTTVGVAAVASFEVVGRREDHVRAFVVEVFGTKFVANWLDFLLCRRVFVEFGWLGHDSCFGKSASLPFYSFPMCPLARYPHPPAINPFNQESRRVDGLQSDNKRVIRKFGKKELALEKGVQYSWFDITNMPTLFPFL